MYITWVVYVLFIALCVWGGRFAGFGRGKFHEDSASLDVTKALRGIAATGVILHHISQEESFHQAGVIQAFCNVGFLFVAVFFFWSGFGLIKSLASKPGYLDLFLVCNFFNHFTNQYFNRFLHIFSGKSGLFGNRLYQFCSVHKKHPLFLNNYNKKLRKRDLIVCTPTDGIAQTHLISVSFN